MIDDELYGEIDCRKWAKEFVKVAKLRPDIPTDEDTMRAWFAAAIVAGTDYGKRDERMRGIEAVIKEIAYQSAGAGSGAVMESAPDVVMPSEEIMKRVDRILMEFGIQPDAPSNDQQMGVSAMNQSNKFCDDRR